MVNYIVKICNKISRLIYWITPAENRVESHIALKRKLFDNLCAETFDNFSEHFKKSILYEGREDIWKIRNYAIKKALLNDKDEEFFYMEFGVWNGTSANYFSRYLKKLYAFDSFEGLEEDWVGTKYRKGTHNLNKVVPKLNSNVTPIVGWVEDTLEDFLKKNNPKINFVHIDVDTYTPTKFILNKIKPFLVKDAIIIFDELYNYFGWEQGEYKALTEVFDKNEYDYRAFTLGSYRAVIQIK